MGHAYRAVLFDMDGVLVDSREAWFRVVTAAAEAFACPPVSRATFDATFGQGVRADADTFFPGRTTAEVDRYYTERFADHVEQVSANPDAESVLDALRSRGCSTAVVTNTPAALARAMLAGLGLKPDVVVGAMEGMREKPAPDLVIVACGALDVDPEEAVLVGDSDYDRAAAEAAGVAFVGYRLAAPLEVVSLHAVVDMV